MTKEEKELLLKDLCMRLSYGVICYAPDNEYGENGILYSVSPFEKYEPNIWIEYPTGNILSLFVSEIKPYLRLLTSMTKKEKKEYDKLRMSFYKNAKDASLVLIDWLTAYHFDYRGLIEKGLAIEAPEGMYKN